MSSRIEDLLGSYHKLIMDPVHGGIPVLEHETNIIDHALFQRLRFICQNDILSLVFPGATHSRFLHSIGAMHVGGRMFMALISNCLKRRSGTKPITLSDENLEAISYFYRIIRCACLLHDSGHCSFSHQFSRSPAIANLLKQPERFEQLWSDSQEAPPQQSLEHGLEHEHYSLRVAQAILSDCHQCKPNAQLPNIYDVLSLMENAQLAPSSDFKQHAQALWPLLAQARQLSEQPAHYVAGLQGLFSHLVSGELDADRADYMLRDGFHASVTIGGFNLDHLLSNLHIGICAQTGWMGLAISEKGLGALEDFVYSRHQMYRQVYAHKTAQGFDWLLRAAIDEVMQAPDTLAFIDQCLSQIKSFKHLSDSYFWEAFRRYAQQQPNTYSECILDRIKMPFLATRTNLSAAEEETYSEFLAREQNIPRACIISSSITARFTKIREQFDDIKVLCKDIHSPISASTLAEVKPDLTTPVITPPEINDSKLTSNETFKRISAASRFFDKFSDDRITHFYIDPVKLMRYRQSASSSKEPSKKPYKAS